MTELNNPIELPPEHTPLLLGEWQTLVANSDTLLGYLEWLQTRQPREWLVTVKVTLERRIILDAPSAEEACQEVRDDPALVGLELSGLPDGIDILDGDWSIAAHEP